MQSGRGDEATDGVYRPQPIPREPQAPAVPQAHEGIVLPAHGDQPSHGAHWDQPTQVVQPVPGQPWGAPQDAQQTEALHEPQHGLPPGPADGEATALLAPYGHQPGFQLPDAVHAGPVPGADAPLPAADSEKTQLIPPFQSPELPPAGGELRRPLPPEQPLGAPIPPLPQQPPTAAPQTEPAQPPMPNAAPFAVRPGAPGDHPVQEQTQQLWAPVPPVADAAEATQHLPRFDAGQQQPQAPAAQHAEQAPQVQDDYDFLYRREDESATPPAQRTAAFGMPPQPPYAQPPQRDHGYDAPAPARRGKLSPAPMRGKLSPAAMIGIGVAGLAVLGVAVGAALSGGGDNAGDQQKAGVASPAAGDSGGPGTDPVQAQAKQLDALLKDSNSSRSSVISAVEAIKSCGNLAQAATDLRSAATQRGDLTTRLSQLTLDKLPDHVELVNQLNAAWKSSADADNDYAAWADEVAKDKRGQCHKGHARPTLDAQKGNAASGEATIAKKRAAGLWNPIAKQYGLTQRQFTDL